MDERARKIRDGIFDLHTRRIGKAAEVMIKLQYDLGDPKSNYHDLYDNDADNRVEVKFSRAQKSHSTPIQEDNVPTSIIESEIGERMFKEEEWNEYDFDCNIQQVKTHEFDILYYGIFFEDIISIFKIESDEIGDAIRYSNKQHKGNVGEGQFHLNPSTYRYHLDNHLEERMTYSELYDLLSGEN